VETALPARRAPRLSIRLTIFLAALLPAALTLPGPLLAAGERLPIFDTHLHYSHPAWAPHGMAEVLSKLDAAGVPRALLSSTPDEGTLTLYRAHPQRFVPILRPYREGVNSGNWFNDAATPAYLAGRLAKGFYRGIGEFHLFSSDAARTPVLRKVARLAVKKGIHLHVHAGAGPVAALFEQSPEVKILWGHAGMVTPVAEIRRMMTAHPNLIAELSFREGEILRGDTLDKNWQALLLAFPRRFLIGSDTYANHRWEEYPALVEEHRNWLKRMPADVARRIAYDNAARIFGWGSLKRP
jgi:hypothetical protein